MQIYILSRFSAAIYASSMKKSHNWYFGVVMFQVNTEGMLFVDIISFIIGKSTEHMKSEEALFALLNSILPTHRRL